MSSSCPPPIKGGPNIIWLQNLALLTAYTLVGALLPLTIRADGYSDSTNGLVLGVSLLGLLIGLVLLGPWIDRGDPRLHIASGALVWAITSVLLATHTGLVLLIICWLAQGFAYAEFYTASLIYATRRAPSHLPGGVVGMMEAVGALAIAAAPFAAFPLAEAAGARSVYASAAGFSLLAMVAVVLLPPEPGFPPKAALPVTRPRLISREAILPGFVAACLFAVAVAYVNLAPLIALRVGTVTVSIYMALRAFCTVPTRLVSGSIADRKGPAWAILPGFAIAMLAMLLMPCLISPGWAYLVPVLFGLGMGLASPALTVWMLKKTLPNERAVSINTYTIFTEGSGFFSSWMVGVFLQADSLTGFAGLAGLLALGMAVFVVMEKRSKERTVYDRTTISVK